MLKSIESEKTYSDLSWVLKDLSKKIMEKYSYNILIKYGLFLSGLLAAMGHARAKIREDKEYERRKQSLLKLFNGTGDPLRLNEFNIYYNKFTSGIGAKRRKLVYRAFLNFFLSRYANEINWREAYEEIEA